MLSTSKLYRHAVRPQARACTYCAAPARERRSRVLELTPTAGGIPATVHVGDSILNDIISKGHLSLVAWHLGLSANCGLF